MGSFASSYPCLMTFLEGAEGTALEGQESEVSKTASVVFPCV